jgi:hypothetical protein
MSLTSLLGNHGRAANTSYNVGLLADYAIMLETLKSKLFSNTCKLHG